jgi:hypothetical protein
LPRWILAVVALVYLILFVGFHRERHRALAAREDPRTRGGEGLVIRCDGHGYYAWLRSALIDGDWSFDNEFDEHNPVGDYVTPPEPRTALGLRPNQWSVGPALLWALTVLPGHVVISGLEGLGAPWPADGYSLPYQLLVGITTLAVSLLGVVLLYASCRRYAGPVASALATAFLTLGSGIVYYGAIEVTMAHSVGPAVVAGLIWYWLTTYGSRRAGRWLLVGILVGAAGLMRWQLVTFAVLPAGECLLSLRRGERRGAVERLALAAAGAVLAFLPQVIAWQAVYGQPLVRPIAVAHNWNRPDFARVLLDQDRGLFYWTPITLLACLGFLCVWGRASLPARSASKGGPLLALRAGEVEARSASKGRPSLARRAPVREALALLFAAFALQVYVMASLWGEAVQLGVSYGLRHFTETVVALGPGLALLLGRATRRRFLLLCGLGCLLVLWNLLLIAQYRYGWIPAAAGAAPQELLGNVPGLVARKRLLLVGQVLLGPLLLWLLARRAAKQGQDVLPHPAIPHGSFSPARP